MGRKDSQRLGELVEEAVAERYNAIINRNSWRDLTYRNGKPINVKATLANQTTTRFRIWEKDHDKLVENSGYYVFVLYQPRGKGVEMHDVVRKKAATVGRIINGRWYRKADHPKNQREFKLPADKVF